MRRIVLSLLVLITDSTISRADITGNGYYRVQNQATERWASLVDNTGWVDFVAGTADLHSLRLTKDYAATLIDPASVIYLEDLSDNKYNVATQGTSLEALVDNPIYIRAAGQDDGQNYYRIWGKKSGVVKYIADGQVGSTMEGEATINNPGESATASRYKNWFFVPIDVNSGNYVGVTPNTTIEGKPYCTFYASFPFKTYSPGMKVYYIGRAAYGMAELLEIDGVVPAGTPVLIQCVGNNSSDNKLQIVGNTSSITPNVLKGVYFNYNKSNRSNRVAYDAATMRILGACKDGSLGFVTANIDYIPANTAYLTVAKGSAAEFKCVNTEVFEENYIAGVDSIENEASDLRYYNNTIYGGSSITVVNLSGQTVLSTSERYADVSALPKGVYVAISNGKSLKFVR